MKKLIVTALVAGLVGGAFVAAPAVAKRKKPKKPKKPAIVQVDQKYMLRRDGCGTDADNTRLSLEDGPDQGCWASDAGIAYEVVEQAAENGAPFNSSVLWEQYPAENGVPLVLDASKSITGDINLYGGACVVSPAPCSPAGVSAGQATIRVRAIATIDGEDKELGTFEETFTATPGSTHTSKVDIKIDPALNGATVEAFRIEIFKGGMAYGPGGIEYDDPASFIVVPTFAQA